MSEEQEDQRIERAIYAHAADFQVAAALNALADNATQDALMDIAQAISRRPTE